MSENKKSGIKRFLSLGAGVQSSTQLHQSVRTMYTQRGHMNIKSNAEAFELALWLAITAETEEQSRSAINLAIEVGSKIPREQCEAIKLKVELAIAEETGHVH